MKNGNDDIPANYYCHFQMHLSNTTSYETVLNRDETISNRYEFVLIEPNNIIRSKITPDLDKRQDSFRLDN